jgi:hypothetical protein
MVSFNTVELDDRASELWRSFFRDSESVDNNEIESSSFLFKLADSVLVNGDGAVMLEAPVEHCLDISCRSSALPDIPDA